MLMDSETAGDAGLCGTSSRKSCFGLCWNAGKLGSGATAGAAAAAGTSGKLGGTPCCRLGLTQLPAEAKKALHLHSAAASQADCQKVGTSAAHGSM